MSLSILTLLFLALLLWTGLTVHAGLPRYSQDFCAFAGIQRLTLCLSSTFEMATEHIGPATCRTSRATAPARDPGRAEAWQAAKMSPPEITFRHSLRHDIGVPEACEDRSALQL
jgi:hypothetical protein